MALQTLACFLILEAFHVPSHDRLSAAAAVLLERT